MIPGQKLFSCKVASPMAEGLSSFLRPGRGSLLCQARTAASHTACVLASWARRKLPCSPAFRAALTLTSPHPP